MFWNNSFPDKKTGLNNPSVPSEKKDLSITRLFEDILCAGSILRVKVTGRSMTPFMRGGEIVTLKNVPYVSLHRGDLIFFKDGQQLPVLHRIVHKRKGSDGTITFLTKGDALRVLDDPISGCKVLGKVVQIEKIDSMDNVKYFDMESKHLRIVNYGLAIAGFVKTGIFYIFGRLRNHRPSLNMPTSNRPVYREK